MKSSLASLEQTAFPGQRRPPLPAEGEEREEPEPERDEPDETEELESEEEREEEAADVTQR